MSNYTAIADPGRLDQFWAAALAGEHITRARVQDAIRSGLAVVDGVVTRKPGFRLRGGEALLLSLAAVACGPKAQQGALRIVYQDDHLAVVDKPPGLTVHPAPSCPQGTLVNLLLHHFPQLAGVGGERPGIVHRIDKDTSGLLAVALHEAVRQQLARAFAARSITKTYLAIVHGAPPKDQGAIHAPIGRDPSRKTRMAVVKGGREAASSYQVVWRAPDAAFSLVEVHIATGRTHQIRVHMEHIGHPLLGDSLYAPARQAALRHKAPLLYKLASRQMLHAWKLSFVHPATERELAFTCAAPKDFWRVLLFASRRTQRIGVVGLPGSGKSAVLEAIGQKGWPVWSADACVAALYEPGEDGWQVVRSRFGDRFTPAAHAPVDKKALLEAMRGSETFRREIMDLLYPLVRNRLEVFFARNGSARAAFAEVPMLLEAGWLGAREVDFCLGVFCRGDVRHGRLASLRGWDASTAALFDSWQWPQEKKMAACRPVLDNSGTLADTAKAVEDALCGLRRERIGTLRQFLHWLRGQGYA